MVKFGSSLWDAKFGMGKEKATEALLIFGHYFLSD
jgi:hypothetical protein